MRDEDLRRILKIKATPFYVFDYEELYSRITLVKDMLPENVHLCYAVKANPFLMKEIADLIDRFEVCSPGELRIFKKLKLPIRKLVLSGVYKDENMLKESLTSSDEVGTYTVESYNQFLLLRKFAKEMNQKMTVLLRLTSGNQFGMDETVITKIIKQYQKDDLIKIKGIQFFSGTQNGSLKRLEKELWILDDFLEKLNQTIGFQAEELEFGSGFPVSYFQGEEFNEAIFFENFFSMINNMRFKGTFIIETGRSLVASCGTYLTKVVDTKKNHGYNYAIVDGGKHQLTYYGQSMALKSPNVCLLRNGVNEQKIRTEKWTICGALCTINDLLAKQLEVDTLEIGDVLAFQHAGAYCMTEGIALFLSRDLPEIILRNKEGVFQTLRASFSTEVLNTPNYGGKKWKKLSNY